VHYLNQHLLWPPRRRGNLDSRFPILLQLRSSQPGLYLIYNLPLRLQEVGKAVTYGWLALLHPGFYGRRRELLHGPRIQVR